MFVVLLNYKKPLETVDQYLSDHSAFLESGYHKNHFVVSGRKQSQTGGVIISQLTDAKKLEKILQQDPFHLHGIADYEIIEFTPRKFHPDFTPFIA